MENANSISAGPIQVRSMNPKKFGLWLFLISVVMIFISLTSAYIVKKAEGDWLLVDFPAMFKITSVLIVISSITMHMAYIFSKRNNLPAVKMSLTATALLAFAFSAGQFLGWKELVKSDIYFVGNAAGSFIYVFTGLHLAHLLGGIIFLFIVLKRTFQFQVHSKNMLSIELCTTYWHFLGGLWLYLYLFLILNN